MDEISFDVMFKRKIFFMLHITAKTTVLKFDMGYKTIEEIPSTWIYNSVDLYSLIVFLVSCEKNSRCIFKAAHAKSRISDKKATNNYFIMQNLSLVC